MSKISYTTIPPKRNKLIKKHTNILAKALLLEIQTNSDNMRDKSKDTALILTVTMHALERCLWSCFEVLGADNKAIKETLDMMAVNIIRNTERGLSEQDNVPQAKPH